MDLSRNAERFTGKEYLEIYHKFRPDPPTEIIHQSLNYVDSETPGLVIDLGCGTGISTRIWSDYASLIIGVEPSKEMISLAEKKSGCENISYKNSFANHTGLYTASADIVTCSQSFHWMEPKSTLQEIDRILKPGGVLVIYDVIWPPSVNYLYEAAYRELFRKVDQLTEGIDETIAYRWNRSEHFSNIKNYGHFKFYKESYYHKSQPLDKSQFIGLALSQGGLEVLFKRGFTEKEVGFEKFLDQINSVKSVPFSKMCYHYKVIYAIK